MSSGVENNTINSVVLQGVGLQDNFPQIEGSNKFCIICFQSEVFITTVAFPLSAVMMKISLSFLSFLEDVFLLKGLSKEMFSLKGCFSAIFLHLPRH